MIYQTCPDGHECTSGCQKDFDCPCIRDHEHVSPDLCDCGRGKSREPGDERCAQCMHEAEQKYKN